jgi:triphosphatase
LPEIELRLAVRAADLPRLRRALEAMTPDGNTAPARLVSTYYDTADRALARRGWVLRVRQRDGNFIQTVKSTGIEGETLLARGEWEDPVASAQPDPQAGDSGRFLTPDIADRLNPLFRTEVTRRVTDLSPAPGIRIEAAIDRGEIRAPGNGPIERIGEIELELNSGPVTALYDLALQLLASVPLRLELRSKSDRGCRLAAGRPSAAAARAEPFALDPLLSADTALQHIGRACLVQAIRNEDAIRAGRADGVHQMRVAVRRLRAALSGFREILPVEQRRWACDELRWLAGVLGDARNFDVFISVLLGPVRDQLPRARQLDAALGRRRRAAYTAARRAIRSPRYTALMLRLLRWFDSCGWREGDGATGDPCPPIGEIAPQLLDRRRRAAKKTGKGFARQSPQERHKLRIALKKLRYTSELLGALYDASEVRKFTERLKQLQDDLGLANDVRVAEDIVAELAREGAGAAITEAGRRVLDLHRHRLAKREPEVRKHLRRLFHTKPFWRR